MKNQKYSAYAIILLTLIVCGCKIQRKLTDQKPFTYFTRQSRMSFEYLKTNGNKWVELKNDTVIYTQYFKASPCDLPSPDKMSIKISNDTLVFDFGLTSYDPNCERRFGVGGIMVDFVVDKRQYPDYQKLIIRHTFPKPNWNN